MAKQHMFYCWMRVIERPTGRVGMMIPSKPPKRSAAKDKDRSDFDEVWQSDERHYNEPPGSDYVLDYWSGGPPVGSDGERESFASYDDAKKWFDSGEGQAWMKEATYYTLMSFDVKTK